MISHLDVLSFFSGSDVGFCGPFSVISVILGSVCSCNQLYSLAFIIIFVLLLPPSTSTMPYVISPLSGGRLPHFDANFCPNYAKILESPSFELRISLYILHIC